MRHLLLATVKLERSWPGQGRQTSMSTSPLTLPWSPSIKWFDFKKKKKRGIISISFLFQTSWSHFFPQRSSVYYPWESGPTWRRLHTMGRQASKASRASLLVPLWQGQGCSCSEPGPGAASSLTTVSSLLLMSWLGQSYSGRTFYETPLCTVW